MNQLWAMFFVSLASWKMHPGYNREGAQAPDLDECAALADQMLGHYLRRYNLEGERRWHGSEQQ